MSDTVTPTTPILFSVPDIRCGGCVAKIERALTARDDVAAARVNLTLRRVSVTLKSDNTGSEAIGNALGDLGFAPVLVENDLAAQAVADPTAGRLLRAIAVAGFGATNIMLLSVAVWSGAEGATRDSFHLISGLIALPVVTYAGRPFFGSALGAVRAGRMNMDVPITLGVLLAMALSLFELATGGDHVFFDAAVTLLFFLLTGRYLDQLMRDRARSAVTDLARITPRSALLRQADGVLEQVALDAVPVDAVIHIPAGARVPLDVRITQGTTDIDRSVVTGEAMALPAGQGDVLEAGTLNLTGDIDAVVLRGADESFLAQMMKMLASGENGRSGYVRIADRAARLYAPVVHLLALATFIGWMLATNGDWQTSVFIAISALIITCPCALGLAVPVVQVIAAGRLMKMGVLMKDGGALERMAEADHAVFDKTGTLTTGTPRITGGPVIERDQIAAQALARHSTHPAAQAIAAGRTAPALPLTDVQDLPGFGVRALLDGQEMRLGRASWVAEIAAPHDVATLGSPAFAFAGRMPVSYNMAETLRAGARHAVSDLHRAALPVTLLSGDTAERADDVAGMLGISDVHAGATPQGKIDFLDALKHQGARPLMVGDGLNDAAALANAHVSMAPATASDVGRSAADFVFLRESLEAVPQTRDVARRAAALVRQNFGLAIIYNCIAIPLAVAGYVTPLLAALAMSGSSIIVIANSLRLNRPARHRPAEKLRPEMPQVTA